MEGEQNWKKRSSSTPYLYNMILYTSVITQHSDFMHFQNS